VQLELRDLNKLSSIKVDEFKIKTRPLNMEDFSGAFRRIKSPLTKKDVEKYERWAESFGLQGA